MLNCSDGSMLFSSKKRGDASIRGGLVSKSGGHDKTRGVSVLRRGAPATARGGQVSDGGAKPQKKVGRTTASTKRKPSDK